MEAGLDSLSVAELRGAVLARFGVELPATAALDHPTVAALAQLLARSTAPPAAAAHAVDSSTPSELESAVQPVSAEAVLKELQGMLRSLLGSAVSAGAPMMAAGLDSLAGSELRALLAARFGADLPATAVFDHPTPAALAAYITEALGKAQRTLPPGSHVGPGLRQRSGERAAEVAAGREAAWASEVAGLACIYPGGGSGALLRGLVLRPAGYWATVAFACTVQRPGRRA